MRLLHVTTKKLTDFSTQKAPKYAILSHRWRHGLNEVLYDDVEGAEPDTWQRKKEAAAKKVLNACAEADRLKFEYIWIDTCCIDKRSSSELSEAINSMFLWYRQAGKCLAFLDDVNNLDDLGKSEWFERGWTLQELIAPDNVWFYSKDWSCIGDRFSMVQRLSDITGIDEMVLRHGHEPEIEDWDGHYFRQEMGQYICNCGVKGFDNDKLRGVLDTFSVATIMSWAARRKTSREEDTAYCLMGLFDINMPLLYGERSKAFIRLQEEIIGRTNDQSILAWTLTDETGWDWWHSFDLASSPAAFHRFNIKKQWSLTDPHYDYAPLPHISVTKEGVEVDVLLIPMVGQVDYFTGEKDSYLAILNCTIGNNPLVKLAIALGRPPWSTNMFDRPTPTALITITPDSSLPPDGSVFKCIAQMLEPEKPPEKTPEWRHEIDLKGGEVKRIVLTRFLLRRGPHSRNRYLLPPLLINKIVDCDVCEYVVDYAMPGFDKEHSVAWACNEDYGLMLLTKQGSQEFFVLWGTSIDKGDSTVATRRDDLWCKIMPLEKELGEVFAKAKRWGRHQRSERNSTDETVLHESVLRRTELINVSNLDRAVLDFGGSSREVLAEIKQVGSKPEAGFAMPAQVGKAAAENASAPTNPRGIPCAPFVDKAEDYVSSRHEVEATLRNFQEMISYALPSFPMLARFEKYQLQEKHIEDEGKWIEREKKKAAG
ncbi:hypothetical protein E0Z10_g1265 [Xylaria hypoxylon]|uniref:Uncharacterized protein n=1 Tax=Xylaria hypoxylon TaxID=37992 RepID=A0A4Z0Z7J7_9PEZI|nr:hypothetical protein E0Z10_g1265 [Xylaria hypoxylon]